MATVRLQLATDELARQFGGPTGMAARWLNDRLTDIRNLGVLYSPVDTGRLRGSITVSQRATGAGGLVLEGRVGTDVNYAVYVHEGVTERDVTVHGHTVRAHTVRRHKVAQRAVPARHVTTRTGRTYHVPEHSIGAHTVYARSRLQHVRGTYTRHQHARTGRPFLRTAMEQVLDGG